MSAEQSKRETVQDEVDQIFADNGAIRALERARTERVARFLGTMRESLYYNFFLPVSTKIVGMDDVDQLEQNVKWASQFSPLSESEMRQLEYRTLPIVRQGLYFRRWNLPT